MEKIKTKCHNCHKMTNDIYPSFSYQMLVCYRCKPKNYSYAYDSDDSDDEYDDRVNFLDLLPNEIIVEILSFLDSQDIVNFKAVSLRANVLSNIYYRPQINKFLQLSREFTIGQEYFFYDLENCRSCIHNRPDDCESGIYCYRCQMEIKTVWIYGLYERNNEFFVVYNDTFIDGAIYYHHIDNFQYALSKGYITRKI